MDPEVHSHWNVGSLKLGSNGIAPSYAAHLANGVSLPEVEEITAVNAAAQGIPFYPHFHAPLTPERNFLHYLISAMVCNAAVPSKEYLQENVRELFQAHVVEVTKEYQSQLPQILAEKQHVGDLAVSYMKHKESHASAEPKLPVEYQKFFEKMYEASNRSFVYQPANLGTNRIFKTKETLFRAACENEFVRWKNEQLPNELAHAVVGEAIAQHRLNPLPEHSVDGRHNIVIAGVLGAGKNVLCANMMKKQQLKRENFSYIDLDEYKEFDLLVSKKDDHHEGPPSWNKRAHDECHVIRRKILEELKAKTETGMAPDVFLLTSQISERAMSVLRYDNPKTNIYLVACEPERALLNCRERFESGGRRMSTEVVLRSVKNLSESVASLLPHTQAGSNLSLELLDSTHAREPKGSVKQVLTADAHNGAHIFDMGKLVKAQKGEFIHIEANHPSLAYTSHEEAAVLSNIKGLLLPHHVTVYDDKGKAYALKKPGEADIRPIAERSRTDEKLDSLLASLDEQYPGRLRAMGVHK